MNTKYVRIIVWLVLLALATATQPAFASRPIRSEVPAGRQNNTSAAAARKGNAPAAAGDEFWDDQFLLGIYDSTSPSSSAVYAITVGGTDVYVGGAFDRAGNVAAHNIARWDTVTSQWSALGGGVDGWVYAIAVDGEDVYVGGHFLHAGGIAVTSLAKWNTTSHTWSAVGGDLDIPSYTPDVNAIAVAANGDVFVGGSFVTAGGLTVNNIARWDGSSWHALSTGTGGTWPDVKAIAITGNDVYIGGSFATVGGNPRPGVARWNGSAWSGLGSGVGGVYAEVDAIAIDGTNIYIGGRFAQVTDGGGAHAVGHVAMWNGAAWNTMGGGVANPDVAALARGPDGIYVGGRFQTLANGTTSAQRLARWDGSVWHSIGGNGAVSDSDGVDSNVYALAFMGREVFLGGFIKGSNDGRTLNFIGYWDIDYAEWFALGSSVNGPIYALAMSGDDVYLGGSFTSAGGVKAWNIARWNQRTGEWSSLGGGVSGCTGLIITGCRPEVFAIAVDGQDVYVGGNFTSAGIVPANSIARWDSTTGTWHALGDGVTCNGAMCSAYVRAICPSAYYGILVGGKFDYAGGSINLANNIAVWSASSWGVLGDGTTGPVDAIVNPGSYYVDIGGNFTNPGSYAAEWDDVSWNSMGYGLNGTVHAMTWLSGLWLYIGGEFKNAGGMDAADYIAKFDGSSWVPVGAGLDGPVYALDWTANTLYAGGSFTAAGIVGLNRIAQWKSNTWSGYGSGVDDTVLAVAYDSPYLYGGGSFLNAGGKPSAYFGRWGQIYYLNLPVVVK